MVKIPTSVSLEESFVNQIDNVRGSVPRSVMVQDLIDRGLASLGKEVEASRDVQ